MICWYFWPFKVKMSTLTILRHNSLIKTYWCCPKSSFLWWLCLHHWSSPAPPSGTQLHSMVLLFRYPRTTVDKPVMSWPATPPKLRIWTSMGQQNPTLQSGSGVSRISTPSTSITVHPKMELTWQTCLMHLATLQHTSLLEMTPQKSFPPILLCGVVSTIYLFWVMHLITDLGSTTLTTDLIH